MPMYRYVCQKCGNEEVHLHGINDSPNITCSQCGNSMSKAVSRVGIVFKGSGFYITDSKKTNTETKKE